jgi:deazaflavin-dependent oxidoreductase (nitroreductase family)
VTAQPAPAKAERPVPRPLIKSFWFIHRAIVRVSGGRVGFRTPEAGKTFGMARLTTIGRRSGRTRVAMVGYYEDGPNLVTLAMNGWGKTDPAWWLNLQAVPEARIELPDGPRLVVARAATGAERDRLWEKFAEYPGWGADLDALSAGIDRQAAVVVLEPRSAARS